MILDNVDCRKQHPRQKTYVPRKQTTRPTTERAYSAEGSQESYSAEGSQKSYSAERSQKSYSSDGSQKSYSAEGRPKSYSTDGRQKSNSAEGSQKSYSAEGRPKSYSAGGRHKSDSAEGRQKSYSGYRSQKSFSADGSQSYSAGGSQKSYSVDGSYKSNFTAGSLQSYLAKCRLPHGRGANAEESSAESYESYSGEDRSPNKDDASYSTGSRSSLKANDRHSVEDKSRAGTGKSHSVEDTSLFGSDELYSQGETSSSVKDMARPAQDTSFGTDSYSSGQRQRAQLVGKMSRVGSSADGYSITYETAAGLRKFIDKKPVNFQVTEETCVSMRPPNYTDVTTHYQEPMECNYSCQVRWHGHNKLYIDFSLVDREEGDGNSTSCFLRGAMAQIRDNVRPVGKFQSMIDLYIYDCQPGRQVSKKWCI